MEPIPGKLVASAPGRIPTLDGWRAIAILSVLVHHATLPFVARYPFLKFPEYGVLGVDVFFALSGFLICSVLIREQHRKGRIDLGAFYIRRAFRILPLYFAFLLIVPLLAQVGGERISLTDWFGCLFFYRNYLPAGEWSWTTGHFWSLSVEEHFYLLFPAFLALAGAARARRVLPLVLAAATLWRMCDYRWRLMDVVLPGTVFPFRSDIRLDGIGFGCMAALLLDAPAWRARAARLAAKPILPLLVSLFLACAVFPVPLALLWQKMLLPAMIVCTALAPSSWASRILETAPLRWVSGVSFALFIWQQLFLPAGPSATAPVPWQAFPLNLPLLAVCAFLSDRLLAQPAVRLGKRLLDQWRKARPPAGAAPVHYDVAPCVQ